VSFGPKVVVTLQGYSAQVILETSGLGELVLDIQLGADIHWVCTMCVDF
jgi:hypothetical protein